MVINFNKNILRNNTHGIMIGGECFERVNNVTILGVTFFLIYSGRYTLII